MKTILSAVLILLSQLVYSQYYYNDIKGTKTLCEKMKNYTSNKVSAITATGFDAQGAKTSDFNEWQEIDLANNTLKITNRNGQQVTRHFYQFDKQFNLLSITDSSDNIKSISVYSYDAANNLISIKTTTRETDTLSDFGDVEERQWKYNAAGKPERLLRILNGKDTTDYRFTIDQKGNVADEQLFRRAVGIDPVYYYYDDNNRLTDIVRYNKRAKKLLPDILFEYDESNRVIQKITTVSTINPDYLIWRYGYDEKGLETKEVLYYKKMNEVTLDIESGYSGKIEYSYSF